MRYDPRKDQTSWEFLVKFAKIWMGKPAEERTLSYFDDTTSRLLMGHSNLFFEEKKAAEAFLLEWRAFGEAHGLLLEQRYPQGRVLSFSGQRAMHFSSLDGTMSQDLWEEGGKLLFVRKFVGNMHGVKQSRVAKMLATNLKEREHYQMLVNKGGFSAIESVQVIDEAEWMGLVLPTEKDFRLLNRGVGCTRDMQTYHPSNNQATNANAFDFLDFKVREFKEEYPTAILTIGFGLADDGYAEWTVKVVYDSIDYVAKSQIVTHAISDVRKRMVADDERWKKIHRNRGYDRAPVKGLAMARKSKKDRLIEAIKEDIEHTWGGNPYDPNDPTHERGDAKRDALEEVLRHIEEIFAPKVKG